MSRASKDRAFLWHGGPDKRISSELSEADKASRCLLASLSLLYRMVEKSGLKHSVQCALGTSMRMKLAGAHHAGIDDGSVGTEKADSPFLIRAGQAI